jgi:hypothetical protein
MSRNTRLGSMPLIWWRAHGAGATMAKVEIVFCTDADFQPWRDGRQVVRLLDRG